MHNFHRYVQVVKVASMWDKTLKTRLDAAHAQIKALDATNQALEEEAKRHDDEMAATVEQFSREKARIVKNYQQLYTKFQEIRSRDRSVCFTTAHCHMSCTLDPLLHRASRPPLGQLLAHAVSLYKALRVAIKHLACYIIRPCLKHGCTKLYLQYSQYVFRSLDSQR